MTFHTLTQSQVGIFPESVLKDAWQPLRTASFHSLTLLNTNCSHCSYTNECREGIFSSKPLW